MELKKKMIHIITTGGTIEGLEYDNENRASSTITVSISELLEKISFKENHIIQKVFSKDSRFITDNDRESIVEAIEKSPNENILITHGTLTMIETAKYLGRLDFEKIIILTGAFILGTQPKSDAPSNLEFALLQFNSLSPGVYIAMQHDIFPWKNVKKNTTTNQFEKLN